MDNPAKSKISDGKLNRTNSEKKKLSRKMVSFLSVFLHIFSSQLRLNCYSCKKMLAPRESVTRLCHQHPLRQQNDCDLTLSLAETCVRRFAILRVRVRIHQTELEIAESGSL